MAKRNVAADVQSLSNENVYPWVQALLTKYPLTVSSKVIDKLIESIDGTPPVVGATAQYDWLAALLRVSSHLMSEADSYANLSRVTHGSTVMQSSAATDLVGQAPSMSAAYWRDWAGVRAENGGPFGIAHVNWDNLGMEHSGTFTADYLSIMNTRLAHLESLAERLAKYEATGDLSLLALQAKMDAAQQDVLKDANKLELDDDAGMSTGAKVGIGVVVAGVVGYALWKLWPKLVG